MAKIVLGAWLNQVRGKTGNAVYYESPFCGGVMRDHTIPRDPRTPLQRERRSAFSIASTSYRKLDETQLQAWDAYMELLMQQRKDEGIDTALRRDNVYIALASKVLQITPDAPLPIAAPTSIFQGDGIAISASAHENYVRFSANMPNTSGVVTELLLQRLNYRSSSVKPREFRTAAFHAFASGALSYDVGPLKPGYYAAASRFVVATTGQAAPLLRHGVVSV